MTGVLSCDICRRVFTGPGGQPRRLPVPRGSGPRRRGRPSAGASIRGAASTRALTRRVRQTDRPISISLFFEESDDHTRTRDKAITGMVRNHLGKYKSPRKRRRMLRSWSCQSAGWCKRHHKAYPPIRMGCIPLRCSTVSIRHRRCRRHRSFRDHDSRGCRCRCSGWRQRRSRRRTCRRRTRRFRWEEVRHTPLPQLPQLETSVARSAQ